MQLVIQLSTTEISSRKPDFSLENLNFLTSVKDFSRDGLDALF